MVVLLRLVRRKFALQGRRENKEILLELGLLHNQCLRALLIHSHGLSLSLRCDDDDDDDDEEEHEQQHKTLFTNCFPHVLHSCHGDENVDFEGNGAKGSEGGSNVDDEGRGAKVDDDGGYGSIGHKEEIHVCALSGAYGRHADYGNDNCKNVFTACDAIIPHQLQEHAHRSSSSHFCKHGQGLLNIDDGFHKLVIASSGHIWQLNIALDALLRLHRPQPTKTYVSLLQACNKFKGLSQAKQVYAHIALRGAILTRFLGDYLVMTLAKCGAVDDARELCATLHHRTVFSCTAILSAYVECGEAHEAIKFYHCMEEDGMEPDSYTFVSLFKACGSIHDLEFGKGLHMYACMKGITCISHVTNTLVSMYGKCGAVTEAEQLFCAQSKRNIVSWTTMLSAYIEQGQAEKALRLYRQIQEEGLDTDQFAFVVALQACGILVDKEHALVDEEHALVTAGQPLSTIFVEIAQALHADALRKGYICDVFVGTALLTVYGKCGIIVHSENLFRMLTERNLVTWNAMLSAYMDQGQEEKALLLYSKMQKEAIKPEQLTFVIAFQACGNVVEKEKASACDANLSKVMSLEILQALHADFCIAEPLMSTIVATALLSSYAKCGAVVEAEDIFEALSNRDVVSWNAMLTAYVEQGEGEKAIFLFRRMQEEEHMTLDDVTMIIALLACSETGSWEVCKHLHFGIVSTKFDVNLPVSAALIHAYGNCASMIDAVASFDAIPEPDIASWNSCIAGHAGEGSSAATLSMFENAKLAGMKADEVVFTSVLMACAHTGLVTLVLESFESMIIDFGVTLDVQHYSILVDLLARAGDLKKVENLLGKVDMRDNLNTWLFLLGACHTHSNIELARQAFGHALSLQPEQATAYVLMSNIYANAEVHAR